MSAFKDFWTYDAFLNQLLVNGYIRRLQSNHHPSAIIDLTFQYQQSLTPKFINTSAFGDSQCIARCEWKTVPIDTGTTIKAEKSCRTIIEPNTKWCYADTISLNNKTYPLQYTFTIKCIKNMLNKAVYIGIRNDETVPKLSNHLKLTPTKLRTKKNLAFFMSFSKNTNKYNVLFTQFKYWYNEIWSMDPGWRKAAQMVSIPVDTLATKLDAIDTVSIVLNCKEWRLYFLFNSEIIHSMKVAANKSYIPLIVANDTEIEYEIIKMKCNIIESKRFLRQNRDLDKYIFMYITSSWDYIMTKPNIKHSKQIMNLLWNGRYKILYFDVDDISTLFHRYFPGFLNKKLLMILEIYQYFCMRYRGFIQSELCKKHRFERCNGKVSSIIMDFLYDNLKEPYNEFLCRGNRYLSDAIKAKILSSKGFKLWMNLELYCPTCGHTEWSQQIRFGGDPMGFENNKELYEIMWNNDQYRKNERHWKHPRYRTKNIYKKRSFNKRMKDKQGNAHSKKQFKRRHQLSLQY